MRLPVASGERARHTAAVKTPHPFLIGLEPTVHIAHRGGALLYPENTIEAFRQATGRHGTDIIETDVQITADGEVVIFHDDTLERCTNGKGPIRAMRYADLVELDAGWHHPEYRGAGLRVPRLSEVLAEFPEMRFNIDLKRPGHVDAFADALRADAHRVCVGSELDDVAEALLDVLPDACHFYPRVALTDLVMAAKSGLPLPDEDRFDVLDMPLEYGGMRLVDAAFIKVVTGAGKWVNVWTIDDPADMRQLIADGVGGIMTDRPDLLREVLDQGSPAPDVL